MITVTPEKRINELCGHCNVSLGDDGMPIDPPRAVIRIVVFSCFRRAVCADCALTFVESATKAGLEVVELLRL